MSDVTRILSQMEAGDPVAAERLLPLVYDELRRLATQRLAQEQPGQTLQATALVHEAYLRLAGEDTNQKWDSRGHFFAAAAEAMRRILVEQARRKARWKRGGELRRIELDEIEITAPGVGEDVLALDVLALDEALCKLSQTHPVHVELIKLRYFAGLSGDEAAQSLRISPATADRYWTYARAWLYRELSPDLRA